MKKTLLVILFLAVSIGVASYFLQERTHLEGSSLKPEEEENQVLFSAYFEEAYNKMSEMSLDAKISQLLLVRHPSSNDIAILTKYQFGGFVFFASDFKNKTKEQVIEMIQNLQDVATIPLLTAIDEEGGTVSRISSNQNLVTTPFKSPQELYKENGYQAIYDDVINKSNILQELGLNLNLAPVVDVSTNPSDYIYKRTLGMDTTHTCTYAKTVIEASHEGSVSYTLKHFPGYGSNRDTHTSESVDSKTLEELQKYDLPPFITGIEAKAEAIMVSHNIVSALDQDNPASLSLPVHEYLLNDLKFTGIIITDDISMGALTNVKDTEIKAIKAQNDLLITSNYERSFNNIKNAVLNGTLTEDEINEHVFKVLAWKYYKKLL